MRNDHKQLLYLSLSNLFIYLFLFILGPSNVLNTSTGLYQQSVTLTARMWPPIEAGSPKIIWGLPVVIWSIIIGFIVIIFILASLFLCCWLLPRHRKILSPTRDCTSTTVNIRKLI